MQNTTALVLAGGINLGFSVLTHNRAKSALPFGGHFRVIDYILTNLSNSGVNNVGILIQYLPGSLIDHVGVGASWDFATTNRRIKLMPPFIGMGKTDWFRGSADAIYQNLNYIHDTRAENVLVLSADHVYCMDYSKVLAFHKQHNADLTIVTTKRPSNTPADHFGYVTSDENKRVTEFLEKPHETPHDTVSTGIYLFSAQALIHYMKALEDRASKHDLPTSVVVPLSKEGRVFAYSYEGDWNCLPDLQAYVDHHFQVLRGEKSLHLPADPIITNLQDRDLGSRPSPYFGRLSNVQESMISPGCVVEGTVIRSVLSPGVYIGPHAHVENSILFHDCQVHEGVNLQGVFCDKDVVFHPYCQVGEAGLDPQNPDIRKMTLIGKGAQFAQGVRVG
ncbi:MAG: glucose-1-phosphate adenylyltransferase family protein, partial [Candidatus Sumerlaeota bacterium]